MCLETKKQEKANLDTKDLVLYYISVSSKRNLRMFMLFKSCSRGFFHSFSFPQKREKAILICLLHFFDFSLLMLLYRSHFFLSSPPPPLSFSLPLQHFHLRCKDKTRQKGIYTYMYGMWAVCRRYIHTDTYIYSIFGMAILRLEFACWKVGMCAHMFFIYVSLSLSFCQC